MKQTFKILGSAFVLAMALSACGGGGGGGNSVSSNTSTSVSTTPATLTNNQILADLDFANISLYHNSAGQPVGTWRWPNTPSQHIYVYVPVPTNTVEQDIANKVNVAISTYNAKLSNFFVLEAVSTLPATGNVVQVGYNNAWIPPGSTDYNTYCANVSNVVGFSSNIMPDAQNNIVGPVYLNLGNGHCTLTQDIVVHEFAHSLGLGAHFDVFGNTAAPDNFWDVLATLYGNPQSTVLANIVVQRAAK